MKASALSTFAVLVLTGLLLSAPGWAIQETFDADLGMFSSWDSEANTLTATWNVAAGTPGGGMVLSPGTANSNVGIRHFDISPNTFYMVTCLVQVQAGGTSPFWFEVGLRTGATGYSAADFDSSPGSWFIPAKWEFGADNSRTKWPETANGWKVVGMSVYAGGSDAVLSLGFKLGGSGAPNVHIDDVHITIPAAESVVTFDDATYDTFVAATHGYGLDGSPGKPCGGVIPPNSRIYCPSWMGAICDGGGTSAREDTTVYSGAAWRLNNSGGWGDGSPVFALTTTPGTVYTANFWMARGGTGDAWTNADNDYNAHCAWRLTDNPDPGSIEGWPGAISPNAFHLMLEGASNTERNYAPDIYAPGSGAAIQCLDTDGDRYSTMAFEAADATSWFETCIRTLKGGKAGSSYWILDDFQLFVHDNEMLTDVDDWMLY